MQFKRSGNLKKTIVTFLLIVAAVTFFTFPIPYYIEGPGGAMDVDPMIHIEGEVPTENGTYMMTTISIQKATPFTFFKSYLPFYDRLTEEEVFGQMGSFDEYLTLQQYYMNSSQHAAIQAAFEASDLPSEIMFHGVHVMTVDKQSDFYDQLHPGDIIVSIDGESFEGSQDFIDKISTKEAGDQIDVSFERNGQTMDASGKLIFLEETGKPGIGISLVDHTDLETTPKTTIDAGAVGGPSAGFMFSLRIYTLLNNLSLSEDYQIAGTGTIDTDGNVGRIGGIDKKIVAADEEGATIFLAPDDEITDEMREAIPEIESNYEEAVRVAKAIGTDMKVIPIKHLQDGIDYVESLP